MSQIICARSSLVFSCDYLPISLKRNEISHPFFHIPRKDLLSLAGRWSNGELSPQETYLYFLSLLDSSSLIIWRHPVTYSTELMAIIQANMEKLLKVIYRMHESNFQHLKHLPHFSIDYTTSSLSSIPYFIKDWDEAITESIKGYKSVSEIYDEQAKESAIERLIKSPYRKNDKELANKLADWAESAGQFPDFETITPNGKSIQINILWKEIIRACVDDDRVHDIPRKDLEELEEHIIDNIPQGTIHSSQLLKFIRTAKEKKTDYLSLGFGSEHLAGKTTSFTIVRKDTERAGAIISAIKATAPTQEPKRSDYKSLADFIRAKSRWNIAKDSELDGNANFPSPMSAQVSKYLSDESDSYHDSHNPDNFPSEDDLV